MKFQKIGEGHQKISKKEVKYIVLSIDPKQAKNISDYSKVYLFKNKFRNTENMAEYVLFAPVKEDYIQKMLDL